MAASVITSIQRNLEGEVRRITRGTSSKFVPEPSIDECEDDLFIGMRRFRHAVRSKARLVERLRSKGKAVDADSIPIPSTTENAGLGTGLRPTSGWTPDTEVQTFPDVEAFLYDVEKELFGRIEQMKKADTRKKHHKAAAIEAMLSNLRKHDEFVACPTDKTNSFVLMKTADLNKQLTAHLEEDAVRTTHTHLTKVIAEAKEKLETVADLLSPNEYNYIKSTINKHNIPTVQLLVKDHKSRKVDGNHPSRLVIPAKNFTAGFPHVGQHGIRKILDKNEVNYSRKTIIQASDLKEKLEKLNIQQSNNTIISFDCEKMYPSVKFIQIRRATAYFLRDASQEDKAAAERCLEMVKFGIANTLVQSQGQYWQYGGDLDVDEKGLTIGGYESAFFADLVAAWLLENTVELMLETEFNGIYRDDGLLVFDKKKSTEEVVTWLRNFQSEVNDLCGSEHLQFTVDIWNPEAPADEKPSYEKVTIHRGHQFPYLDIELYWRELELKFQVHMKANQELKYLNEGSAHTNATFKSIPSGVLRRLSVLTSVTPETENTPLNKLYPHHARALEGAGLPTPKIYPTLLESLQAIEERKIRAEAEAESTDEVEDEVEDDSVEAKRKRDRARS